MSKLKSKAKAKSKKVATPTLGQRLIEGLDEVRRFLQGEEGTGVKVYLVKVPPHVVAVRELKAAREAAGLSVADVAAKCGVSAVTLAKLEAGKVKRPTVEVLERYALAVGRELRVSVSAGK